MIIWVDDVRKPPRESYIWVKSVWDAIETIVESETNGRQIEMIDLDHDAGDFYQFGGDYIKILDWLSYTGRNYDIKIHSANPVGVENMRRAIRRNGWNEVST